MKHLKLFENHINEAEIAKICEKYYIFDWTLNSDGTVDIDGDVYLNGAGLTKLPLKFGRVDGTFYCYDNKLTSLVNSPQYVEDSFYCYDNKLTSLVDSPKYVCSNFNCQNNEIRSFEGIGHIGRNFHCDGNPIFAFWRLFQDTSKIELFNEWGVIQNDQVILYRLNDFLQEIGKDDVTEEQLNVIKSFYDVI